MSGLKNRSKSVILRWAATYLLVLLIPLTCFTYSSLHMTETVKQQISASNEVVISSVAEEMDRKLNILNAAFSFTYTRRDLRDSCYAQNDDKFPTRYVRNIWEAIKGYIDSSTSKVNILIYYPERDYIIAGQTANDFDAFYTMQRTFGTELSADEWRELLSGEYNGVSYFFSRELRGESHENCIVLANSMRYYSRRANLFITIPLDEVQSLMDGLTDRFLMLADKNGTALYLSDDVPALDSIDLSRESGSYITAADGRRYVCDYRKSSVNSWYYAIFTAETSYWSTLNALRLMTALSIATALVLGVMLSVVFLQRNYRPVDKLMRLTNPSRPRANEFEWIERSIRSLADEKNAMRETLDQQSAELQEYRALSETEDSLREKFMPRLLELVCGGETEEAAQLTAGLFAAHEDIATASFPLFRICVLEQLYPILNAYYAATDDPAARQTLMRNMENVMAAPDAVSLQDAFSRLVQYASASLRASRGEDADSPAQQICEYVQQHYGEYDLNVSRVAEAFGRHPQTVSRQFSAEMNVSLLDYINALRIDHAVNLLQTTRLSIEEIAQQSGFSDARTFRRVFSKAKGANPSAYRE